VDVSGDSEQMAIAGYRALHLVAHSYLGSLWIALDQRNGIPGKPVLLRRVQLTEHTRSEALQRMACAGRDAMALSHENVLPVIEVLLQGDTLALAYEYVEAEPLRALQSWASQRGLAWPVEVSLRLCIDLLRGVKALHGTLLGWPSAPPFGGLSPDSVLVSRDGRTRLCDPLVASCATLLEGMSLNVAKLAYTAPEQAYATAPLGAASDIFSCGVLLWELLAGTRLLTGSRPTVERKLLEHDLPPLYSQLRSDRPVSDRLLAIVERSLASDAGRRPQTPGELANDLEQCGHELASLGQVAAFVAELAGARFDQRRMTVRSLPSLRAPQARPSGAAPAPATVNVQRRVPLPAQISGSGASLRSAVSNLGLAAATPHGLPSRPRIPFPARSSLPRLAIPNAPALGGLASARPAEASRTAGPPVVAPALIASPGEPAAVELPSAALERAEPVVVPPVELAAPPRGAQPIEPAALPCAEPLAAHAEPGAAAPASEPALLLPVGSTTIMGLALPPPLANADIPFGSVVPTSEPSSSAVVVIPPDPQAPPLSTSPPSAPPLPVPSLVPTLRPDGQGLGAGPSLPPSSPSAAGRRPSGWSQAPAAARHQPRRRAVFASLLATVTLGAALASALVLRSAPRTGPEIASAAVASHDSNELAPARADLPPEPMAIAQLADGGAAEPADAGALAASVRSSEPRSPEQPVALSPAPTSFDVAAPELGDEQLRLLFALERRAQLPSCRERLGASARSYSGASPDKSQAQLKAARRELLRGNNAEAQRLLCSATAHFADNVAAWQSLAELSLHLGDAARAQQALEQALKRRPNDATLIGLLGDAQALLGDFKQSRALWAKSLHVSAKDAQSYRRMAPQFTSIAARKLHDWSYGAALLEYRRAAVLSFGDTAPSAGMGETLRLLGQPQAALAWADRAAARAGR
jgi:serine/threonine protein kinase/tetratricopeptide (TPR) repeat protein